jgi:hypothetical protein
MSNLSLSLPRFEIYRHQTLYSCGLYHANLPSPLIRRPFRIFALDMLQDTFM